MHIHPSMKSPRKITVHRSLPKCISFTISPMCNIISLAKNTSTRTGSEGCCLASVVYSCTPNIHRRFQGRELTRALMVTAEGSAERRVASICTSREARKIFQFFSAVIWMSSRSTFMLCFLLPCTTGLAIPAMNSHAHNYNAQLK